MKKETGHALPIAHDPYLRRKGIPTTLCRITQTKSPCKRRGEGTNKRSLYVYAMIPRLKSPCKQGLGLIVVKSKSNSLK